MFQVTSAYAVPFDMTRPDDERFVYPSPPHPDVIPIPPQPVIVDGKRIELDDRPPGMVEKIELLNDACEEDETGNARFRELVMRIIRAPKGTTTLLKG